MSNYVPKTKRPSSVSVAISNERAVAYCDRDDHFWRPITDITKCPSEWQWTCAKCGVVVDRAPANTVPNITLKELEEMVDSSCRVADKVIEDDQTVQGELWLMRSTLWLYWPYKFHCIYHVLKGSPFILLFRWTCYDKIWHPINDTDSYRKLLVDADKWRLSVTPGNPVILLP